MLGEFLSANVAMPFLLFMVKGVTSTDMIPYDFPELLNVPGFNEFQEESDIAFYTGILGWPGALSFLDIHLPRPPVAAFFLTQFLTSLLWVCTDHFRCGPLWFA